MTFVLLGTGPSLCADDVDYVKGKASVIAINDAYTLAPWADVLFAADLQWWRQHQGVPSFQGKRYRLREHVKRNWIPDNVMTLKYRMASNFETDPRYVGIPSTGKSSSGYMAINLAVHLGATRILLLGYDCCRGKKGAHFFGSHWNRLEPPLKEFAKSFRCLVEPLRKLGIAIVNCSRETIVTWFPRQPLREALC